MENIFAPKPPPFDMYDDLLTEDPIESTSSPAVLLAEPSKPSVTSSANPISVLTTSTLSFSIDGIECFNPHEILFELAKDYVASHQASGVLGGGFVNVDEEVL